MTYFEEFDCAPGEGFDARWERRINDATARLRAACPPLSGSLKQIAWAEDIREKASMNVGPMMRDEDEAAANLKRALEIIRTSTEAGWWIDRRHRTNGGAIFEETVA